MIDITHKNTTLRTAVAQAIVKVSHQDTIDAVINNTVPKGNVFEMAKTAGLFAVKKTSDMIPDCHPLPVEYTGVNYDVKGLEIHINMEVKTIYRTGVEVKAMQIIFDRIHNQLFNKNIKTNKQARVVPIHWMIPVHKHNHSRGFY